MFENSSVTWPSQLGSNGVTLTIIPHLAYVDLPRQMTKTSLGILKYSTVLASANEFGGIIHSVDFFVTKFVVLKFFGCPPPPPILLQPRVPELLDWMQTNC